MIIVPGRSDGAPTSQRGATFTGTVWADPVVPASDDIVVNTVFFQPGARHSGTSMSAGSYCTCWPGAA